MTALAAYLRRLGFDEAPPPTLESLRALHRAHLERIPYENLGIQLGQPPSADPKETVRRIAEVGRAGYCFHQNGAFEVLLRSLGYAVTRRHGHVWANHVWANPVDRLNTALNHLVLVVSGLPTDDNPGGHWWVDAGLGDGFAEPLSLVRGTHEDGGFRYEIGAGSGSQASGRPQGPAAWTFEHDPAGAFSGVMITERDSSQQAVDASHRHLSTDPASGFVKLLTVMRRDATGVDVVRGCVLQRVQAGTTTERDLTSYAEWREALADATGLPLDDVDPAGLEAVWTRMRAAHEAWRNG